MNEKNLRVALNGTLLVPVGNTINLNFVWLGTLRSSDNTVQVIGLKSNNKEDFINLLDEDLETLKKQEPSNNIQAQIGWIEKTLAEISDSVFVKKPEKEMLEAAQNMVSESLRWNGKYLPERFSPENVIYTSGCSLHTR